MRTKVGIVFVMALVAAALAAYLAFNVVRDRGPVMVQATEAPTAHVVVAAHDMDLGHVLTADDIRLAEWPSTMLPEGYSNTPAEVVGRGLIHPVKLNEPLLAGLERDLRLALLLLRGLGTRGFRPSQSRILRTRSRPHRARL